MRFSSELGKCLAPAWREGESPPAVLLYVCRNFTSGRV